MERCLPSRLKSEPAPAPAEVSFEARWHMLGSFFRRAKHLCWQLIKTTLNLIWITLLCKHELHNNIQMVSRWSIPRLLVPKKSVYWEWVCCKNENMAIIGTCATKTIPTVEVSYSEKDCKITQRSMNWKPNVYATSSCRVRGRGTAVESCGESRVDGPQKWIKKVPLVSFQDYFVLTWSAVKSPGPRASNLGVLQAEDPPRMPERWKLLWIQTIATAGVQGLWHALEFEIGRCILLFSAIDLTAPRRTHKHNRKRWRYSAMCAGWPY